MGFVERFRTRRKQVEGKRNRKAETQRLKKRELQESTLLSNTLYLHTLRTGDIIRFNLVNDTDESANGDVRFFGGLVLDPVGSIQVLWDSSSNPDVNVWTFERGEKIYLLGSLGEDSPYSSVESAETGLLRAGSQVVFQKDQSVQISGLLLLDLSLNDERLFTRVDIPCRADGVKRYPTVKSTEDFFIFDLPWEHSS